MKNTLLFLALIAAAGSCFAATPSVHDPKENAVSPSGTCHEMKRGGDINLSFNPLNITNVGTTNSSVVCVAPVRNSGNGTTEFGIWVFNTGGLTTTINCVGYLSTGGYGPIQVARGTTMAPFHRYTNLKWTAADLGEATLKGQISFVCSMPPKSGITWSYSIDTAN